MNQPVSGGVGVNPIPYDFTRFAEYDARGKLITNDTIERTVDVMRDIYSRTPAFTVYSKAMIDGWVQTSISGDDITDESRRLYEQQSADYLAVVRIENGFFEQHNIIIKKINIDGSKIQTEFSATDNGGNVISNLEALEFIANNVVLLMIYEDVMHEEIMLERNKRLAG